METDKVAENIIHNSISAVLGGPGIGKSTVSLAAVQDSRVEDAFGGRRAWIRCEQAPTADLLRQKVIQATGLPLTLTWLELRNVLAGKPTLLVLDNFETSWQGDEGREVEEQVSALASCKGLHLLLGIRGAEYPPDITEHETIGPLAGKAARAVFRKHSGNIEVTDDELDAWLAREMEGLPLAIELAAKQASHSGGFSALQQRWTSEKTNLLRAGRGDGRLDSLDVSLALSAGRLTGNALRVAGILGMLPAGLATKDLETLGHSFLSAAELYSVGLVLVENARFRALAPVREYFLSELPPDDSDREACLAHFIALAKIGGEVGGPGGAEAIALLAPEVPNVEAALLEAFTGKLAPSLLAHDAVVPVSLHWARLLDFAGLGTVRPIKAAAQNCQKVGDILGEAHCIFYTGSIHLARSLHSEAKALFDEAIPLYQKCGGIEGIRGEANCTGSLGDLHFARSQHDEAGVLFEEAIPLFQKVGGILGEANCIFSLGQIHHARSQHDEAKGHYNKAIALYKKVDDIRGEANCALSLGDIHYVCSQFVEAKALFNKAISLYQKIGDIRGEANCIKNLGDIHYARSQYDEAKSHY